MYSSPDLPQVLLAIDSVYQVDSSAECTLRRSRALESHAELVPIVKSFQTYSFCKSSFQSPKHSAMMFSFLVMLAGAISAVSAQCTAERRIDTMKYITAAFNEKDFAKSAALIQGMPLQADCPAVGVYTIGTSLTDQLLIHISSACQWRSRNPIWLRCLVDQELCEHCPPSVY